MRLLQLALTRLLMPQLAGLLVKSTSLRAALQTLLMLQRVLMLLQELETPLLMLLKVMLQLEPRISQLGT